METLKTYFRLLAVLACMGNVCWAEDDAAFAEARKQRQAFRDDYMEVILAEPKPPAADARSDPQAPVYSLAALYTGKDVFPVA